jgi:N-[(2S)-2-amino-2-carboxyethyl]-L-glutamate dehydrogenase
MNDDAICYLTEADTRTASESIDPVDIIRRTLMMHAAGKVELPSEAYLGWTTSTGAHARSINMPAMLHEEMIAGTKIINSSLDNVAWHVPRASGLTMLFDISTARVECVMAAAYLSALRTAAVTVAAAAELMRPGATSAAVVGAGAIGERHLLLLARELTDLREVSVYDQSGRRAQELCERLVGPLGERGVRLRLAESAAAAVAGAELVVPCTTTDKPYIEYEWLQPGALVVNVSLDDVCAEVFLRADLLYVDDWNLASADHRRLLGQMHVSGQLIGPGDEARGDARRVDAELGQVFAGDHPGRTRADQIILVNPFGMAISDISLGFHIYQAAIERGLGTRLGR